MFIMPKQYCFLCASDEGVFLDLTRHNKRKIFQQLQICELVKIPITCLKLKKICHKCAYELNQCSNFIEKFKQVAREVPKNYGLFCSVCLEPAKKEFIFDLSREKSFQPDSQDNIYKFLNQKYRQSKEDYKLICLSCRYTIDVLLDLKNIRQETSAKLDSTIGKDIDHFTSHKINTTVISRKTTITRSARIHSSQELMGVPDKMIRTRSQNKKLNNTNLSSQTNLLRCEKCNSLEPDKGMAKKAKGTVCKRCWKVENTYTLKKENHGNQGSMETKSCSVFLKDVLKTSDEDDNSLYRIDEDKKGNKKYIVTDSNSTKGDKHDITADSTKTKSLKQATKRQAKTLKVEKKDGSHKRQKTTVSESELTQSKFTRSTRSTRNMYHSSDSDIAENTLVMESATTLTTHKRKMDSSLSDADVVRKRKHRKLSTTLSSGSKNVYQSNKNTSDDKSNGLDIDTSVMRDSTNNNSTHDDSKTMLEGVTKDSVEKQTELYSFDQKVDQQTNELESDDVMFVSESYVCDECGASYENKLLGLTHKLSHYKQPRLKLQRLSNESIKKARSTLMEVMKNELEDDSNVTSVKESNNLNISDRIRVSVDLESKSDLSERGSVEDSVDVELVMTDIDDDHLQKSEKEQQICEEPCDLKLSTENISEPEESNKKEGSTKNDNDEPGKSTNDITEDENMNSEGFPSADILNEKEENKETIDKEHPLSTEVTKGHTNGDVAENTIEENVECVQSISEDSEVSNSDHKQNEIKISEETSYKSKADKSSVLNENDCEDVSLKMKLDETIKEDAEKDLILKDTSDKKDETEKHSILKNTEDKKEESKKNPMLKDTNDEDKEAEKDVILNDTSDKAEEIENISTNDISDKAEEVEKILKNNTSDKTEEVRNISTNDTSDRTEEVEKISTNDISDKVEEVEKISTNDTSDKTEQVEKTSTNDTSDKTEEVEKTSTNDTSDKTEEVEKTSTNDTSDKTEEVEKISTNNTSDKTEEVGNISTNDTSDKRREVEKISTNDTSDKTEEVEKISTNDTSDKTEEIEKISTNDTSDNAGEVEKISMDDASDKAEEIGKTPTNDEEKSVTPTSPRTTNQEEATQNDVTADTLTEELNLNNKTCTESTESKISDLASESAIVTAEVMREVLDLASAEVKRRKDLLASKETKSECVKLDSMEGKCNETQNNTSTISVPVETENNRGSPVL